MKVGLGILLATLAVIIAGLVINTDVTESEVCQYCDCHGFFVT